MVAGLQVRNDGGVVQIDETFRMFQLRQTVDISSNTTTTVTCNGYVAPIPVAYATQSPGLWQSNVVKSGSNFTFTFKGGPGKVLVFDLMPFSESTSTAGMQVFNAAGELVVDTGYEFMKIVGQDPSAQIKLYGGATTQTLRDRDETIAVEDGGDPWVKPSSRVWGWYVESPWVWEIYANQSPLPEDEAGVVAVYADGDNFKLRKIVTRNYAFSNSGGLGSITFVDITGLV